MDSDSQNDRPDFARPKPGYVALLAGAAVLILAGGALLKPDKLVPESPLPLSETAPLQALSRRGELRDQADFLSGRVSAISPHLVYLDEWDASGVAWADPDSVVTVGVGEAPFVAIRWPGDTTAVPALRASADRLALRGWLLVAARRPDGTILSTFGISGGQTELRCGDSTYRELVLATPLGPALAGGGVFDLDGHLLGVVGRCGERYAALAAADIETSLSAGVPEEARLLRTHGLRVTALDEETRGYFAADSGVLVAEVVLGGPASAAGLEPGDVIVAVDSQPVREPEALGSLLPSDAGTGPSLALVRRGRPIELRLAGPGDPRDTSLGLELASASGGIPLARVAPGSPAESAGLRTGDRLVRIGELEPATPEEARRALKSADRPFYLVYRRGPSEHGTLVR